MKALLPFAAVALLAACDPMMPMQSAPYYTPPPTVEPVVAPPVSAPAYPYEPVVTADPPPPPVASTPGDTCGAASLQGFVGSVAPQPFPAPGPVRVYAEGDPVTMDRNPQRVNVIVDRANRQRVVAITCG